MTIGTGLVAVQLMIFSGIPDPEWFLNEPEIEHLRVLTPSIVGVESVQSMPSGGLGYRGFRVENRGSVAGIPAEFTVFRGVLADSAGPRVSYWKDLGRVEHWLLVQARNQGFGEELDAAGVNGEGPELSA